jgi:hypothetical protein
MDERSILPVSYSTLGLKVDAGVYPALGRSVGTFLLLIVFGLL